MKFAILFGGNSYEHEISIVSAVVLKKVINQNLEFIFVMKREDFIISQVKK